MSSESEQSATVQQLFPLVYDELRNVAARYLSRERADHTLQPTALVHEVFLRLAARRDGHWDDRVRLIGMAARAMRQILVDHARARRSAKRGGNRQRINLADAVGIFEQPALDLLSLDEALTSLGQIEERLVRIVELRFFGGCTIQETAQILELSTSTVEEDWRIAKAWLRRSMDKDGPFTATGPKT